MDGATGTDGLADSVVVMGLGYVGLPLLLATASVGMRSVGFDVSETTVAALRSGTSHVDDITDEQLAAGHVEFTTDTACLANADVIVICVPTPLTEDQRPDLSSVDAAVEMIAERITPGTVVILESTTYPGTTDGPVRSRLVETGLSLGEDIFLAFSPERIDPGNPTFDLMNTPKVVGGVTPACTDRAASFYRRFVDEVVVVSGTREAEMAKLLENTYRHVNIALVNEMAVFSHELGIDLWEVIRAAASKPFGFQAFYPGPGVGGHCIPIDPNYLSHSVRSLGYQFRFVELAQEISQRMPAYVVSRAQDMLNDDAKSLKASKVLVLGLTYKAGIADVRETPARAVIRGFLDKGADVSVHDPLVSEIVVDGLALPVIGDLGSAIERSDLVVVLQPHGDYLADQFFAEAQRVFDATGRLVGDVIERL